MFLRVASPIKRSCESISPARRGALLCFGVGRRHGGTVKNRLRVVVCLCVSELFAPTFAEDETRINVGGTIYLPAIDTPDLSHLSKEFYATLEQVCENLHIATIIRIKKGCICRS